VRPSRHSAKTDAAIIPILNIYRKYYGLKMAGFLFVTFYVAMAGAALIAGDDIRRSWCNSSNARVIETSITWNYTTWLNIIFLSLAGLLVWRFLKTGGPEMSGMMNKPAETRPAH
jgi:uncharacterized membrane protein YraQ (UPF0718 family)